MNPTTSENHSLLMPLQEACQRRSVAEIELEPQEGELQLGRTRLITWGDDALYIDRPNYNGIPLEIVPGVTLIQTGGHFDGSAVLHWAAGADGKGALFVGDTITVVPDRRFVSFMTSYPNLIPMSDAKVRRIVAAIEPYEFDKIYGGWWQRNVTSDAKNAVIRSAERYARNIEAD